ncbi:HK97-gp10 family putative phage morphogenesis protein [Halomonas litopenaei]|uniref:HK97-gp10 family putative phage morphogenesis protein n=1 Tax=Halomonas litopenaei TaxID=2109328 RepID=UPI001A8E02BC|nr:HK97-gp10 family putative phage morphogenesis protein [Halomonas litopenaei]MBN8410694.1 HK97 gp10 family phage protein [Halomonas litopenaei]
MADLSFNLSGVDEALAKMKEVQDLPKKKATRFALRKAANLVRESAKMGALSIDDPDTANTIADNIVVRFDNQHFRQHGDLKMSVGVLGGSTSKAKNTNNPGGDTYYWRFKEFGTEKMRADPFMRPALQESIEPATDEFLRQFDKALVRAIKRANRSR